MGKKDRVCDASDKVERLKSLNKMMLKEVSEQRKQVLFLTHSNASLELELTNLSSELAYVSHTDYVVMSQLERTIMLQFLGQQLDEHLVQHIHCVHTNALAAKSLADDCVSQFKVLGLELNDAKAELETVKEVLRITCEERDELKGLLVCNVVVGKRNKEELSELRKKNGVGKRAKDGIFELRKKNREMGREIGELRDGLDGEEELLERIECLVRDKDMVDMSCFKLKEDLSRTEEELHVVVREMGVIREAKDVQVGKLCELENVVSELNETVVSLGEIEQRLLVNVEVLENRCVEGEEKQKLMGKKIDRLLEERKCKEKSIEGMMAEQITLDKKLQDTLSQLRSVKCKLEHLMKRNVGLVEAKNVEMGRRCELENVVTELNETMVGLRQEEQRLVVNVAELEDKCVENEEKQRVMRKKIDRLLEERKCNEKSIEGLMDEQIMLERKLQETLLELHNCKCKLEHLVKQNFSLLEAKKRLCCDVGLLEQQVAELKIVILRLEESKKMRVSNVKSLETEVGNYACKLTRVEAEKSNLEYLLCEEKQNVVTLKMRIENMEMNLEKCVKGAGKVKAENGALLVEKKDLKNQCESLKKEIASLKSETDKAKVELSKMRGNVALAASESELVMNMLDCTLTCCLKGEGESKDGDLSGEETCSGEAKQCGEKFEMIKKAFEVKEAKVDSMRKQLEFLKRYVEEVSKKNGVWEDLSFAIMHVAAAFTAKILHG